MATRLLMRGQDRITNLEQLLQRLNEAAGTRDRVSVGTMIEVLGQKSFGPLLLLAGLIAFSPLSGIPGMPTMLGLIVLLTAGQLLFGRRHFWFPGWVTRRTVSRKRYQKALEILQPAARFTDRIFRPRLTVLTRSAGTYVIAVLCLLVAAMMPPMELLPFAATSAGATFTVFGLALVAHDGVMVLIAMTFTGTAIALAACSLL